MARLVAWICKMIFGQTHRPEVGEEIVQPEVGQKRRREEEEDDMETSKKFIKEAEEDKRDVVLFRKGGSHTYLTERAPESAKQMDDLKWKVVNCNIEETLYVLVGRSADVGYVLLKNPHDDEAVSLNRNEKRYLVNGSILFCGDREYVVSTVPRRCSS